MSIKFEHETGAIIDNSGDLVSIFDGEPGHVDFPDEMIQRLHSLSPGFIGRFTHTHPPGMAKPSNQDNMMMRNLAFSLYPYPVRLGIIVPTHVDELSKKNDIYFEENVYQWVLEPKEIWKSKKMMQNDTKRAIVFERIKSRIILYKPHVPAMSWEHWIIERSYNG